MTSGTLRIVGFLTLMVLLTVGGMAMLFDARIENDDMANGLLGLIVGFLVREGASIFSTQATVQIAAAAASNAGPQVNVAPPSTINVKGDEVDVT